MLKITEKLNSPLKPSASLTLPFEKRQKSRLRVSLDNNQEVALILERGSILRHGELLRADNGLIIEVRAAHEEISVISTENTSLLAKACYHLGNRHVDLELQKDVLFLLQDPVLEKLLLKRNLNLLIVKKPFHPELGAYSNAHNYTMHP